MRTLMLCLRIPAIRTCTIAIFLLGVAAAATRPYQSLIAIQQFGMSDGNYSKMLFAASILAIIYSVALGNLSDMLGNRRRLILLATNAGIIGFASIYLLPNISVFVLSTLFIIPLSGSLFSILFGAIRAATQSFSAGDAAATNSTVRSVFAASWILTPGLVALLLVNSERLTLAYLIASLACVVSFALVFLTYPNQNLPMAELNAAKPSFFTALSAIFEWRIGLCVLAIAMQTGAHHLNSVITPLILTQEANGSVADVGIIAGIVAALEIPFMLAYGNALRRHSTTNVLAFGAAIFALYLFLLGFASKPWHFYALTPINAAGAASILSIPMTYLQDLLPDKPGLGSSLQPIAVAIGGGISAGVFAIGATNFGYSETAWLSGLLALTGVMAIIALDRR